MFGAEPLEPWTKEEAAEFEEHVRARTRKMLRSAGWATAVFVLTVLVIGLFSAGHSLHRYANRGAKYLVFLAQAELVWVVCRWGFVWSSWAAARETRREMGDPL